MGKKMRRAREALDWTQSRAASEIGLSPEFYARIERGRALPSTPTLIRIADTLGVTVHFVLEDAIRESAEEIAKNDLTDDIEFVAQFARENPDDIYLLTLLLKHFEEAQGRSP